MQKRKVFDEDEESDDEDNEWKVASQNKPKLEVEEKPKRSFKRALGRQLVRFGLRKLKNTAVIPTVSE